MKKILIGLFSISMLLSGITTVDAQSTLDDTFIQTYHEEINGIECNITTYNNKDVYKVDYRDANGEKHLGILNKNTDVLTVDGDIIEYSITPGTPVLLEQLSMGILASD